MSELAQADEREPSNTPLDKLIAKLLADLAQLPAALARHQRIAGVVSDMAVQPELTRQAVKSAVVGAGHIGSRDWNALMKEAQAQAGAQRGQLRRRESEPSDKDPSQATKLVELALKLFNLVQGTDGKPYAVDKRGPSVALPLRGRDGVRARVARAYWEDTATAPAGGALSDALQVIEGMASDVGAVPVGLRVARGPAGAVVLDLGDPSGQAVVIEPGSWTVVDTSPVLFRRTALTGALSVPVRSGEVVMDGAAAGRALDDFRALLNVDDEGWWLIVGWLVAALIPDIPHPILALMGEQGTAKTSAMRFCVRVFDPSPAPVRGVPRDVKAWAVTAAAGWTVALDNLSSIPPWFSDTLCKAVTGDGIVERALYSDDDVTVLSFRRVIALTSIDSGALAGDLAERLVPVELQVIEDRQRKAEADIEAAFLAAQPAILGALLDLLAKVLERLPTVRVEELPRMADFTRVLAALDEVTGWKSQAAYRQRAAEASLAVLEGDPLATAIREMLAGQAVGWLGTAGELLEQTTPKHPKQPPPNWPKTPRALGGRLRRLAPALRLWGIDVDHGRGHGGVRQIRMGKKNHREQIPGMGDGSTVTTVTTVTADTISAGQDGFGGGDGNGQIR